MDLILYIIAIGTSIFALAIWILLASAPLFFLGSAVSTMGIFVFSNILSDKREQMDDFDQIMEAAVNPINNSQTVVESETGEFHFVPVERKRIVIKFEENESSTQVCF